MSLAETAASVDGAFTSIPIIDLNKCGTHGGRLATAYEIRDACMRVGFFYSACLSSPKTDKLASSSLVQNHGIPQSCLDSVLAAARTYFSLPMATKMKLHHKTVANFKGYSPPLDSNIDSANNNKGDFHEGFEVGWEEIEPKAHDDKRTNDGAMAGANVWPADDYPGFREACLEYYHAAVNVGKVLFPLFALALDLPETYFDDKVGLACCNYSNSAAIMKALHYPLQEGHPEIDDDTPGIGAHTECSCFTILWQQPEIQALQVMNPQKQWIDAPAIKDTLVINIGDQLALWTSEYCPFSHQEANDIEVLCPTDDVFKSTVHRAMNKSGKERYSIPLFFGTDYHVNIEPIPSCVSADRPAKYSSITAGEYVNKRLKDAYHTA
ncbi:2OG-Fe(II) oxygenase [Lanmaoa asiatica]|nr:2OG-Fe(II) oxygenase [Lanmaoa asiatica]